MINLTGYMTRLRGNAANGYRYICSASDNGLDAYETKLTIACYEDMIAEAHKRGFPWLAVAHYPNSRIGDSSDLWVDGNRLKVEGQFDDTDLARAAIAALKDDRKRSNRWIRMSVAFLPKTYEFDKGGVLNYTGGILIHNALTTSPANPRTGIELIERSADEETPPEIFTMYDDAAFIVGERYAMQLEKGYRDEMRKFFMGEITFTRGSIHVQDLLDILGEETPLWPRERTLFDYVEHAFIDNKGFLTIPLSLVDDLQTREKAFLTEPGVLELCYVVNEREKAADAPQFAVGGIVKSADVELLQGGCVLQPGINIVGRMLRTFPFEFSVGITGKAALQMHEHLRANWEAHLDIVMLADGAPEAATCGVALDAPVDDVVVRQPDVCAYSLRSAGWLALGSKSEYLMPPNSAGGADVWSRVRRTAAFDWRVAAVTAESIVLECSGDLCGAYILELGRSDGVLLTRLDSQAVDRSYELPFVQIDRAEHKVWLVVLEPDTPDTYGTWASAEQIRKAAHWTFLHALEYERSHKDVLRARLCEWYCAPADFTLGSESVTKGTLVACIQVLDDDEWGRIERGEVQGASIKALAQIGGRNAT